VRPLISAIACALIVIGAVHPAAGTAASPPGQAVVPGVVFVANGSGDVRAVSTNLAQIVAEARLPLHVEVFVWSHGYRRYLVDHLDHANHVAQGRRLAAQVAAYRQACPGRRIYLVGHSAGCAVILAAAEALPPDSVDRILLLAPSVCVQYDLRPALRSARGGIDVFYSRRDRMILGLGMRLAGTSDRSCRFAAGQYGFTPVLTTASDAALYTRLRQHPWDAVVGWSGNDGGHYGSYQAGYLRAYVVPLLAGD
jgi:pimeloyl-ACP methyl ester carboxylesterase